MNTDQTSSTLPEAQDAPTTAATAEPAATSAPAQSSPDSLLATARGIIAGGKLVKSDIVAFMTAFVALCEDGGTPAPTPAAQGEQDPVIAAFAQATESKTSCPFAVAARTSHSVFLPTEANRYYSKAEAQALAVAIMRATIAEKLA